MNSIKTVIVEDEEAALFFLKEELDDFSQIEIVSEFRDGQHGLEGINKLQPDLVILDIEMPGLNGFEMLNKLEHQPVIIFCTGYPEYALEAWNYRAADFIVKPITKDRVKVALEKALSDITNKDHLSRLNEQKKMIGLIEISWIANGKKNTRFFNADSINHVESDRDYLNIHLDKDLLPDFKNSNYQISILGSLKELEKDWQKYNFVRIQRKFLINLTKIEEIKNSDKKIKFIKNDLLLPVGKFYYKDFLEKWRIYQEKNITN